MYKTIANCITDQFVKNNLVPEDKKEIYAYGFEIITSTVMYAIVFLVCAIISDTFWTSLIFLCGFYLIRKFCGGVHASTYLRCHLMSAANHIAVILLLLFFPESLYRIVNTGVLSVCILLILFFAPVDHKNKRFTENEFRHFRFMGRVYCGVILIIVILNVFKVFNLIKADTYVFAYTLGTLSATISMLGAKIINSIERTKRT